MAYKKKTNLTVKTKQNGNKSKCICPSKHENKLTFQATEDTFRLHWNLTMSCLKGAHQISKSWKQNKNPNKGSLPWWRYNMQKMSWRQKLQPPISSNQTNKAKLQAVCGRSFLQLLHSGSRGSKSTGLRSVWALQWDFQARKQTDQF